MKILLLLITHFLGYFVFQNQRTLQLKTEKSIYLVRHCIIYSVAMIIPMTIYGPLLNAAVLLAIVVAAHAVIETAMSILHRHAKNKSIVKRSTRLTMFIVSQVLHISILIICSQYLGDLSTVGMRFVGLLNNHLATEQLYNTMVYILLFVICLTPAAELIKDFLTLFQDSTQENECEPGGSQNNSGYIIGIFERIIILMLGFSAQIGAIGFVIAAKSLARFKQLEDRDFAEKYLLGTLLSVVISLACIVVGNNLLLK